MLVIAALLATGEASPTEAVPICFVLDVPVKALGLNVDRLGSARAFNTLQRPVCSRMICVPGTKSLHPQRPSEAVETRDPDRSGWSRITRFRADKSACFADITYCLDPDRRWTGSIRPLIGRSGAWCRRTRTKARHAREPPKHGKYQSKWSYSGPHPIISEQSSAEYEHRFDAASANIERPLSPSLAALAAFRTTAT